MRTYGKPTGLLDLPPELLFDILAYSASSYLPLVNKHLLHTFKYAPPSCCAHFILGQLGELLPRMLTPSTPRLILESALSYPMCTIAVLGALERMAPLVALSASVLKSIHVTPGRWLFRNLHTQPRPKRRHKLGTGFTPAPTSAPPTPNPRTNPLPFLESIANRYTILFRSQSSAFALAMCVRAGRAQYPLLQFLLRNRADPGAHSCLALQVAATLGDIDALKLMIEPSDAEREAQEGKVKGGKRRRIEDRVQPTTKVLFAAVKAKHIDVAEWLMREKGVVPDMATMQMLQVA